MVGTNLIFVDGLPGSGKSTTTDYVAANSQNAESHAGYSASASPITP
jgi:adenylate kinase family enzyme